jgi:hypothetical protein
VRIAGAQHALLIPTSGKVPDAVEFFAAFLRRRIAEAETTIDTFTAGAARA